LLHLSTLLVPALDHLLVDILHHEELLLKGRLSEIVILASGALGAAVAAAATGTASAAASTVRRATSFHRDSCRM
jgi:hypothetical protein